MNKLQAHIFSLVLYAAGLATGTWALLFVATALVAILDVPWLWALIASSSSRLERWMVRASVYGLIVSTLCLATVATGAGPSDKGIQINYGAVPLISPYNGLPAHAVLAANYSPSTVTGNDFAQALRLQLYSQQGGGYNGTAQTAYNLAFGVNTLRGQGQATGYAAFVQGYGKGNANWGGGGPACWGGGETALPSSTPECSALGEYEADQGTSVFEATIIAPASSGMTTLHYTPTAHGEAVGSRLVLSLNHAYSSGSIASYTPCTDSTAGACSVTGGTCPLGAGSSCTVVTFSGSTLPPTVSADATHWYFKSVGNNDDYSGSCNWDDVSIGGKCIGHWHQVASFPDTTHAVLSGIFDSHNLDQNIAGATGAYLFIQGLEATAVDPVNHTITLPANTMNWAVSELIYSPPSHYMGFNGLNIILRKEYKTGNDSAPSYGAKFVNFGPERADDGIVVAGAGGGLGGFRRGIEIENLNPRTSGPSGVDLNDTRAINIEPGAANVGLFIGDDGQLSPDKGTIRMGASGQCVDYCSSSTRELVGKQVAIEQGIAVDAGGKKIATVLDTNALAGGASIDETITWTTPFRGTGYSPLCVTEDSSKSVQVVAMSSITSNGLKVTVKNTDASSHSSFTVHCFAEWRGN